VKKALPSSCENRKAVLYGVMPEGQWGFSPGNPRRPIQHIDVGAADPDNRIPPLPSRPERFISQLNSKLGTGSWQLMVEKALLSPS
jgi:hypothetical protein